MNSPTVAKSTGIASTGPLEGSMDTKIYNSLKKSPSLIKPLQPFQEMVSIEKLDLNYSTSKKNLVVSQSKG